MRVSNNGIIECTVDPKRFDVWACLSVICNFFFQAEDGIRDLTVTGVQTCALPICAGVGMVIGLIQYVAGKPRLLPALERLGQTEQHAAPVSAPWWQFTRAELGRVEIGRASWRERV